MTSNHFDPDAAAGSLQEAHLVSSPELRAKIIDPVVAGALVDIAESLRKLAPREKCICQVWPIDGPAIDCPTHGEGDDRG